MRTPASTRSLLACAIALSGAVAPAAARAEPTTAGNDEAVETLIVVGRQPRTATSEHTTPASHFELRPLESGGQMLEAVPNVLTAQHTGGGKAEQYFVRGFDADHGTDVAIYFDGVPVNLRSHAHGQGFLDLHFVTHETIERLDAYKGPYFTRYGDFATAATIEYVPAPAFDESLMKLEYGAFDTFRAVGIASPRRGPFAVDGPARGFLSLEAYHTDGPFVNAEDLWRYSALARGDVELGPRLVLSGHLLGYHGSWNASGLVPAGRVADGSLDRFGSLDPSEGGHTTRVQGKVQLDWTPHPDGRLLANAYVSYYDFELFSNFTYFLREPDPDVGDGIVQRDRDRVYTGGRVEYIHVPDLERFVQLRGGAETRFDDARVFLGNQTQRRDRSPISDDSIRSLSLEPYADVEVELLPWLGAQAGLRFAWLHFDGRDELAGEERGAENVVRWLPKANVHASPFSAAGPLPASLDSLRRLELFVNFGMGYHSNDARAVLGDEGGDPAPRAIGTEVGARTRLFDRVDVAIDGWYLNLADELVFVGDEGVTESAGETHRLGVELAASADLREWWYLRGDVGWTVAELDDGGAPVAQAPRLIAKAATGVRHEGFSAELGLRHLGERDATEQPGGPKLRDYTVLDLALRYRAGPLELGFAIENLTDTEWSSSEFFYESRPEPGAGSEVVEDRHFSPGNPRNVRAWVAGRF